MDRAKPTSSPETCLRPWDEADRLAALERYGILDTGRESAFDDVAELAADILDAPIAVVNFLTADRQWFKAELGIGTDTLPLDVSICRHAILQPGVFVVPDLTQDLRFEGNPLVHVADGLRFYAGALLETPDGLPLGTVCVLDRKVRPQGISERQERALKVLASQTMAQLELRRSEAIALSERARAEKHARRLSLLAKASTLLLAATAPAAAVRELFALVAQEFRLDVGFHYRCSSGELGLVAAVGLTPEQEKAAARIEFGQTVCGIVAARREAMHVTGIQMSGDPNVAFLKTLGLDSYFSAPLLAGGDLLGTLSFGRRGEPFSNGELDVLHTLVAQLATALERAHAEAEVRASEARFRLMADAVPQIVWITDRHGCMEFLNRQFVDYTGASYEAWAAAEMAANFIHPADGAAVVAAFETALETGEPFEIEHRIRSAVGEHRWFLARAEPYRDPQNGEIVRWFGASVDVHDRKRAEQRLRDLNETLESQVAERTADRNRTWRLSQDLLAVAERDGTLAAVNAAWTVLLGWRPEELVGTQFRQFTHPDDLETTLATFSGIFEAPLIVPYEYRLRHRDGSYRWFAWTGTYEDGRVYASGRHTTAEREQAEALRTAQEALRQSQKMEAMGQLTGGVAHDFNNLLTPIVGSLDMLQRKGLGGEREQRLIAGAAQSAERAKTLVQRLLAFARRQPLQATAVDIEKLVRGMADLVSSTTGPQIKVVVEAPDDLPPASADANQLEMALLNLSVNARDAMPEGGVLRISAAPDTIRAGQVPGLKPGAYIRLSVADTGIGMDEATLARAIEPFFSTKGVGKGTGLGLSMVHGLASQLGGALRIQSRPGLGTNIELWLPQSAEAAEAGGATSDVDPTRGARGTALLVDDEELVRMSTADMLDDLGYRVVEAASAEEALRMVDQGLRPDVLVTDHLMPGMNGTELARTLQARWAGMPVLVVSGYAESEGVAPDLPRLAKPFRNEELAASLAILDR